MYMYETRRTKCGVESDFVVKSACNCKGYICPPRMFVAQFGCKNKLTQNIHDKNFDLN